MKFLTFEEYKELGFSLIAEDDFLAFATFAQDYINYRCSGRACLGKGFDGEIKKCTALIAEVFYYAKAQNQNGTAVIKSESSDGWAASYDVINPYSAIGQMLLKEKKESYLKQYLACTGWLYAGR